jgi:glucose-6-phosphate isomerase
MKNMIKHKISLGLQKNDVAVKNYDQALLETNQAFISVKSQAKQGCYPFLLSPFDHSDEEELGKWARYFQKHFKNVLILGTGGSSLGAQGMTALCQKFSNIGTIYPQIHFVANLDTETFWEILSLCQPETTGVIAISKSGETHETLIQLMRCIEYWSTMIAPPLSNHFLIITEKKSSSLGSIAKAYQIPVLSHPSSIGGRFSCFTAVGLLPAMIAGFNGKKFRQGGAFFCKQFFSQENSIPLEGVALAWAHSKNGINQHVMMPYNDALRSFSQWFCQLWGESLGKNGKGFTPISGLGPMDQHSQLQLYMDGPKNKLITLIISLKMSREKLSPELWAGIPSLKPLAYSAIADLVKAQFQATARTLSDKGCPVRLIYLPSLTEEVLGALMMNYFLETLLMATLLQVNPLDQSAVEQGKILTQELLKIHID